MKQSVAPASLIEDTFPQQKACIAARCVSKYGVCGGSAGGDGVDDEAACGDGVDDEAACGDVVGDVPAIGNGVGGQPIKLKIQSVDCVRAMK
uniref:Uncharacterized protein n=1 Tax=Hyaloperonospora arabidopsidis (strain Emoy2) TaxID=559515 RepID=M4BFH1_HYAAE